MYRGIFAFACACSAVQNAPASDPAAGLSETVFKCNVEPILVRQCSFNACHGIAYGPNAPDSTALRVYSPGKLRNFAPSNIDDEIQALTADEEHGNFQSAAGFNFGVANVADNFLLRKPLPAGYGGYEHKGGAIWTDPSDPQYVAILTWLSGTGACK